MSEFAFAYITRHYDLLSAWAIELKSPPPLPEPSVAPFKELGSLHTQYEYGAPPGSPKIDPHNCYIMRVTKAIPSTPADQAVKLTNEIIRFTSVHGRGKRRTLDSGVWSPLTKVLEGLYQHYPLTSVYNYRRPSAESAMILLKEAFACDLEIYGTDVRYQRDFPEINEHISVSLNNVMTMAITSYVIKAYDESTAPENHMPVLIYHFREQGAGREINKIVFAYIAWVPQENLRPYYGPNGSADFGRAVRGAWFGKRQHLPMSRISTDEPPSRSHVGIYTIDPSSADSPYAPLAYLIFAQLPMEEEIVTNLVSFLDIDHNASTILVKRGKFRVDTLPLSFSVSGPYQGVYRSDFEIPKSATDKLKAEMEAKGIPWD